MFEDEIVTRVESVIRDNEEDDSLLKKNLLAVVENADWFSSCILFANRKWSDFFYTTMASSSNINIRKRLAADHDAPVKIRCELIRDPDRKSVV